MLCQRMFHDVVVRKGTTKHVVCSVVAKLQGEPYEHDLPQALMASKPPLDYNSIMCDFRIIVELELSELLLPSSFAWDLGSREYVLYPNVSLLSKRAVRAGLLGYSAM